MTRSTFLAIALCAATVGSAQADSLFPGGPRFDGKIRIVALSGLSCLADQVGKAFRTVYRARVRPSEIAEAMSVSIPSLAGALIIVADGDGTFAGKNQLASGNFILDAWQQAVPGMVFNLKFTPSILSDSTPQFTVNGTVQNYMFRGCVATIRGSFFLR